jgi:ATP-dependent DNA helicase RecG
MQQTLALFDEIPTVEVLRTKREDQWFDRKSFRVKDYDLAADMIGFANADGGRIVVGIHGGEVEGINSNIDHLNTLLQAAINFTTPPVRYVDAYVDCTNRSGQPDRVLLLDIEASERIHRNKRNECYLRVGDENRKLSPTEERELAFDKGESVFDGTVVPDLGRSDLDAGAVESYVRRVGGTSAERVLQSRGLYFNSEHKKGVTQAGWLLFGDIPPIWSYIRYLRYDGTVAETGVRSNLLKDVRLEGTIPQLIEQAKALLTEEVKVIRLGSNGRFQTLPSLPEFAWLEALVNAVTHRSYSQQGDGIRVKQFTDRLEIESPGRLPELVRVQNIRQSRFSRNPHIARVLAELTDYVREMNEGVERMFQEMEQVGLREPVYEVTPGGVRVTLYKQSGGARANEEERVALHLAYLRGRIGPAALESLLAALNEGKQVPTREVAQLLGVSPNTARKYLVQLEEAGLITEKLKAKFDPTAAWVVSNSPFWTRFSPTTDT